MLNKNNSFLPRFFAKRYSPEAISSDKKQDTIIDYFFHQNKILLSTKGSLPCSPEAIFTFKREPLAYTENLFWLFFLKKQSSYERYGLYLSSFNKSQILFKIALYTNTQSHLDIKVFVNKKLTVFQSLSTVLSHSFILPLEDAIHYDISIVNPFAKNNILNLSFTMNSKMLF